LVSKKKVWLPVKYWDSHFRLVGCERVITRDTDKVGADEQERRGCVCGCVLRSRYREKAVVDLKAEVDDVVAGTGLVQNKSARRYGSRRPYESVIEARHDIAGKSADEGHRFDPATCRAILIHVIDGVKTIAVGS
jgi:hypothetical protein